MQVRDMNLNDKIERTRIRLFVLFGIILSFTVGNILYYKIVMEIEGKLFQQLIRLALTFGLMYLVYIGKHWAKMLLSVLLVLGIVVAVIGVFSAMDSFGAISVLILMASVYGYTLYFMNALDEFDEFQMYQRKCADSD